ncbi:MAG: glycosyltransferase, partial [Candidatus Ranarchaeia archaeon]
MNVLLCTSAAPDMTPFSVKEKRPPLGLGFLISVLRNAGHRVFFIDNYLKPSDFLETDYLIRNRIDCVGIHANTICYRDTLRMLYKLQQMREKGEWRGKIMVGGPHTAVALETIPDFVDYIVQGEGERAIIDILEGNTERVVRAERIRDLDSLPMPAWDYFAPLPYDNSVRWFRDRPVFTMNTSRGCPFNCAFCSVDSIWGKLYTYFSAERIVSDIEYLIKTYGAKGIYFREDNFTLNRKRVVDFCELLLRKGIKIKWVCETRVDTLDYELIKLMYRAGCRAYYLGVESGSQRLLDFMKKGITIEQIEQVFEWCHQIGMKTAASFIVGVPTETEEERIQTIYFAKKIKPTTTWFNVFVGIPRSELYEYVLENNLYEYIDDRGLVYLKGHDQLVDQFYGGNPCRKIPQERVGIQRKPSISSSKVERGKPPKVSVIMSVYNAEKHVKKAIDSILSQTFRDFEFIIINDGSTDRTSEILKSYADPRLIVVNQANRGVTQSLNKAIGMARGQYIARMDADDISLPQRLEMQVEFLEEHPEVGLVGTSVITIDEEGKTIKESRLL